MLDRREMDALWYAGQPVPGARFRLNDPVRVVSGPMADALGSVVALRSVEPEPVYVVELSDGIDATLAEQALDTVV